MDRRKSPSRAGFTLVEVLVAVLIVGTLMAILLPALRGAFRKAQEAQITTEMNNLATALASFKTAYGDYPPSRIILSEEGFVATLARQEFTTDTKIASVDGNDKDITYSQLAQRSLLYLRRFWPRVDFNGTPHDFNNDGTVGGYYVISGSECLTFFLGGQPIHDTLHGTFTLNGFSKLPINPFLPPNPSNPTSTNRTVPNYEFNAGRLVDFDGDGIPSYIDPLDIASNRRAYAYFTSYGTNSYDPNDVNGSDLSPYNSSNALNDYELDEDGMTDVERSFTVGFPIYGQTTTPYFATSPSPNPYCSGSPMTTGGMSWINPNSFQLICAGADRFWGLGGQYVQSSVGGTSKLPTPSSSDSGIIHAIDLNNGVRNRESDNISNFSGGRLD